jgi:hypothetical protein
MWSKSSGRPSAGVTGWSPSYRKPFYKRTQPFCQHALAGPWRAKTRVETLSLSRVQNEASR